MFSKNYRYPKKPYGQDEIYYHGKPQKSSSINGPAIKRGLGGVKAISEGPFLRLPEHRNEVSHVKFKK